MCCGVVWHGVAWRVVPRALVNDAFKTDLCLLHPPHAIAAACVHLAAAMSQVDVCKWLEEMRVDMPVVRQAWLVHPGCRAMVPLCGHATAPMPLWHRATALPCYCGHATVLVQCCATGRQWETVSGMPLY